MESGGRKSHLLPTVEVDELGGSNLQRVADRLVSIIDLRKRLVNGEETASKQ